MSDGTIQRLARPMPGVKTSAEEQPPHIGTEPQGSAPFNLAPPPPKPISTEQMQSQVDAWEAALHVRRAERDALVLADCARVD